MGGFGSGPWPRHNAKRTTNELPALDVRKLNRAGLILAGQERIEDLVRLAWTPCGLGGERPWFVCPGEGCGRRAAVLYLEDGVLLCRLCCDLAYQSQREGKLGGRLSKARRRAEKARARLVAPGEDLVEKPKGMHHKTFVRLGREYLEAHREHVVCYNEWAVKITERFRRSPGSPPR